MYLPLLIDICLSMYCFLYLIYHLKYHKGYNSFFFVHLLIILGLIFPCLYVQPFYPYNFSNNCIYFSEVKFQDSLMTATITKIKDRIIKHRKPTIKTVCTLLIEAELSQQVVF